MRELDVKIIRDKVAEMSVRANYHLPLDIVKKIDEAAERDADSSRDILNIIQKNIKIAGEDKFPLCQDTGLACVFLEIGCISSINRMSLSLRFVNMAARSPALSIAGPDVILMSTPSSFEIMCRWRCRKVRRPPVPTDRGASA